MSRSIEELSNLPVIIFYLTVIFLTETARSQRTSSNISRVIYVIIMCYLCYLRYRRCARTFLVLHVDRLVGRYEDGHALHVEYQVGLVLEDVPAVAGAQRPHHVKCVVARRRVVSHLQHDAGPDEIQHRSPAPKLPCAVPDLHSVLPGFKKKKIVFTLYFMLLCFRTADELYNAC